MEVLFNRLVELLLAPLFVGFIFCMKKGRAATRPNFVNHWWLFNRLYNYNNATSVICQAPQAYLTITFFTAWRILSIPFLVDARLSIYIIEYCAPM